MIAPLFYQPLFDLGRVVVTAAAWQAIQDSGQDVAEFLDRHVHGEWGAVFSTESELNEQAIESGAAIKSVYRTDNGVKIWIVTDAAVDSFRRRTVICLPSEA